MRIEPSRGNESPVFVILLGLGAVVYVAQKLHTGQYFELLGTAFMVLLVLALVLIMSVVMRHGKPT